VREIDRLKYNRVHLRNIEHKQHSLLHTYEKSIIFFVKYHCFRGHIRTFDVDLILVISCHASDVKLSIHANGIHEPPWLVHNNTLYFIVWMNIEYWVPVHINLKLFHTKSFTTIPRKGIWYFIIAWIFVGVLPLKFSDLLDHETTILFFLKWILHHW
jgi:hypothetical protein